MAALLLVVLLSPQSRSVRQLTLRTASGQPIGTATLAPSDRQNTSLSLVARGMPAGRQGTYLLWASDRGRRTTTVGRFMVDPTGVCRARFNLPDGRRWVRFWVTPPGQPNVVVATT